MPKKRFTEEQIAFAFILLTTTAGFAAPTAAQDPLSVEKVMQDCRALLSGDSSWGSLVDGALCLGLVEGVSAATSMACMGWLYGGASPDRRTMSSGPPSPEAGAQAFVNWAEENPNSWGDRAGWQMLYVFAIEFPCEQS